MDTTDGNKSPCPALTKATTTVVRELQLPDDLDSFWRRFVPQEKLDRDQTKSRWQDIGKRPVQGCMALEKLDRARAKARWQVIGALSNLPVPGREKQDRLSARARWQVIGAQGCVS